MKKSAKGKYRWGKSLRRDLTELLGTKRQRETRKNNVRREPRKTGE